MWASEFLANFPHSAEPQDPMPALHLMAFWVHMMTSTTGLTCVFCLGKDRSWRATKPRCLLDQVPPTVQDNHTEPFKMHL